MTHIRHKIDLGADGKLMPFKVFKSLFPISTTVALHVTKDNVVLSKHTTIQT